jgi:hypothetical protein
VAYIFLFLGSIVVVVIGIIIIIIIIIIICRSYKLTVSDQAKVTLQLTVFNLLKLFLADQPLMGGPQTIF